MLKRFTPRLSFANVMSSVAVFLALGGGYATAFSGSGTLQKAAEDGIAQTFEDIRSLNGFGVLQAQCDTVEDDIDYRFNNTTGKSIKIRGLAWDSANQADATVMSGDMSSTFDSADVSNTLEFHLSKPAEGVKAQADLMVTNTGPIGDNCTTAKLRVLALNTQE